MEKLIVQRKIEVWTQDIYSVDEINNETIEAAINYNLDTDDSEVLWETQNDLGPIKIYDDNWNPIL